MIIFVAQDGVEGFWSCLMKCDICGKQAHYGYSVSHSKQHTQRRWLPNVHRSTIIINGKKKKVNICTRCLRTQYKEAR